MAHGRQVLKLVADASHLLARAAALAEANATEAALSIALALAEQVGAPGSTDGAPHPEGERAVGIFLCDLGIFLRQEGRPDRAISVLGRAVHHLGRAGETSDADRARALSALGLAARDEGRADEAEAAGRGALDLDVALGDAAAIVRSLHGLSEVLAARGRFSAAAKCYDWAYRQASLLEDRVLERSICQAHGMLLLGAGRADAAFLKLWRAFQLSLHAGDDGALACAARGLGEVALAGGRAAEARQCFSQMIALGQQNNAPLVEAIALTRRAAAARIDGGFDAANADLRAALALIEPRIGGPAQGHGAARAAIDEWATCLSDLAFTALFRGDAGAAEDRAHQALQVQMRRADPARWKTFAVLRMAADRRGDKLLAEAWSHKARAAFEPPPTATAPRDLGDACDALCALAALAQRARRAIDPWPGDVLARGGLPPSQRSREAAHRDG